MGADVGVVDFLAEMAALRPGAPATSSREETWTYAELDARVDRRAQELRAEGVRAGAVAPTVLEATPDGITTLLALWRVGATPAPLNPSLTTAERRTARTALSEMRPAGAQAILWTSGTEGRPRGVAISAANLRANASAAAGRLHLGPADTWLASLSLSHVGGLALVVRSLALGGHMVAPGRFDVAAVSALIDAGTTVVAEDAGTADAATGVDRPLTHVSFVPTQLLRLLDHRQGRPPPATFRCVLLGGAHAPADLVARAGREGWPVALTYGMTEMTSQVATAPPALVRTKPGTVGRPLDGVELRVSDAGEILVRGPTRAVRYVGTEQALADQDGWYHTGDLGYVDVDGDLWVTGRRSERIVSGGVTVDPLEVEDALRIHSSVADVCVVGLADPEWGELVAAMLVPARDAIDLDALETWARERLAPAKRPRRWTLVDELPRNANGKVHRAAVRAALAKS